MANDLYDMTLAFKMALKFNTKKQCLGQTQV